MRIFSKILYLACLAADSSPPPSEFIWTDSIIKFTFNFLHSLKQWFSQSILFLAFDVFNFSVFYIITFQIMFGFQFSYQINFTSRKKNSTKFNQIFLKSIFKFPQSLFSIFLKSFQKTIFKNIPSNQSRNKNQRTKNVSFNQIIYWIPVSIPNLCPFGIGPFQNWINL